MGTNSTVMSAQRDELNAAINDIRECKSSICDSHGAIARGLIALLRVKVAEIEEAETDNREWRNVTFGAVGQMAKCAALAAAGAGMAWLGLRQ